MEFVVSNCKLNDASVKRGNLFVEGPHCALGDSFALIEGAVYDPISIADMDSARKKFLETDVLGTFNIVLYDHDSQTLKVKTDKIGSMPLYRYFDYTKYILSNSLWRIIAVLSESELALDQTIIKLFLYSYDIQEECRTFFKNISVVRPGDIETYSLDDASVSQRQYFDYLQRPEPAMDLDQASLSIEFGILKHFKAIKGIVADSPVLFGNSGGLDSRLVAPYAKQVGLNVHGVTIGNPYNSAGERTTSFFNADLISELYKIPHSDLHYNSSNFMKRMLLDVRNSPFGNSQLLKNPFEQAPQSDYMLSGGNGYIIGSNAPWDKLKDYSHADLAAHFFKFGSKQNHAGELFERFFTADDRESLAALFDAFVNRYAYKDNISLIRTFHQKLLNKFSNCGGFESLNRTRFSFCIYYPYVYEHAQSWPVEHFWNRGALRNLLRLRHPELTQIPDQAFCDVLQARRVPGLGGELSRRGSGIDYKNWSLDPSYDDLFNRLTTKRNELFDEAVGKSVDWKLVRAAHPLIRDDFLKLKLFFDIIASKSFLGLSSAAFMIKSRFDTAPFSAQWEVYDG